MDSETTYSFLIIDTFNNNCDHISGCGYPEKKIPKNNKEAAEFVYDQYNLMHKQLPIGAGGFVVLIFEDITIHKSELQFMPEEITLVAHSPCRTFLLRSTLKYYLKGFEKNPGGYDG